MIWWLSKPSRARSEHLTIAELELGKDWLRSVAWQIGKDARLTATFELEHLGQWVPMTIVYPSFFPDMPPQVMPVGDVRLSGHQYGAGGELCLEYRPDNWDPAYTGAMMIESAHRLLEGEEPVAGAQAQVENAHATTIGQVVRGAKLRFLVPPSFSTSLGSLQVLEPVELEISDLYVRQYWLSLPRRLGEPGAPMWVGEPDVPSYTPRTGFALKLDPGFKDRVKADWEFVEAVVQAAGHQALSKLLADATDQLVLLIECAGDIDLMWLAAGSGKRTVLGYVTVPLPDAAVRLPEQYAQLSDRSVAIIGCGSIGSKVAASLARAGVGSFVLVDGDICFPGNLVRNDLDWRSVGLNKPDAVAMRIHELRATTTVTTRRIIVGGQESGALTDATLVQVGKCDLIIDATADPQVFNLSAAVARNERKPLVWGEVFAGGIGGLIARARPDNDPVPHAARRQILNWCADQGIEPPQSGGRSYDGAAADTGQPLIADDADVSVIAGQLARLALDTLARGESAFPHPAYAVGLKKGWIFEAPFDTWPIALTSEGVWGPEKDERLEEEINALTAQLFPHAGAAGAE